MIQTFNTKTAYTNYYGSTGAKLQSDTVCYIVSTDKYYARINNTITEIVYSSDLENKRGLAYQEICKHHSMLNYSAPVQFDSDNYYTKDEANEKYSSILWEGTEAEYEALSDDDKTKYKIYAITE